MYYFRGSLFGVSVLVGAAVNRYYYKQTGTDQIPFKGSFQSICVHIKVYLKNLKTNKILFFIF